LSIRQRLGACVALLFILGGCSALEPRSSTSSGSETAQSQEELQAKRPEIPTPPENSDHGYLVDDSRIPIIDSCDGWSDFWIFSGPAMSFDVANNYPELLNLEVSTQIYLKNLHLDPDKNGIICFEDPAPRLINDQLPANVNDRAKRREAQRCRLEGQGLGVGFPRPSGYLPTDGTIEAVMLFVEFTNVKVAENIQQEARDYYEGFQDFFDRQSGSRQQWAFTVPDKVFSIDRDSSYYRADFTDPNFGNPDFASYLQDAVDAADDEVDFSKFDVVYVIPPKEIGSSISFGPAFSRLETDGRFTSEEGPLKAAATAGNDSRLGNNSEPWVWLAHETGHLYGLSHPLDEMDDTDEFGRGRPGAELPELYDLMTWMRSPSLDLWAWSKFWLGWLDVEQVFCSQASLIDESLAVHLNFNDREQRDGEVSMIVIPHSTSTATVVEVRNLGFESRTLVYDVDATRQDREGQIKIVPANQDRIDGWLDGGLRVGESLVHKGLKFSVSTDTSWGVVLDVSPAI